MRPAALAAVAARAEPITLRGVTFSDELGGFFLLGGSGGGAPADPFVVLERIATNAPTGLVGSGLLQHVLEAAVFRVLVGAQSPVRAGSRMPARSSTGRRRAIVGYVRRMTWVMVGGLAVRSCSHR